jgi:hypothetical protein
MRSTILCITAAIVTVSPVLAADYPAPPYSQGPTYQREVPRYEREYRAPAPRVTVVPRVIEEPVVSETVIIRRPVVVARPRVIIEEFPVYTAPRQVYAYSAYPVWRGGPWGHRKRLFGRW